MKETRRVFWEKTAWCSGQRDYVHDHTVFLNNALEWERHQKETQYLLAGARIQQAYNWLQVQFKDSQPPCVPTALQGEYITESIKNAQNLKTQVFLSMVTQESDFQRLSYEVDSIGTFTTLKSVQTYDPRERPWYQSAMEGVKASPVYWFKTGAGTEELGISFSEMVKDPAGTLYGVASVDLSLTQLQTVLENLELETRSHILILEPSGELLASSVDTPLLLTENGMSSRSNALDSTSPIVYQTTQQLMETFGSLGQIPPHQTLTIAINNDKLIARVDTLGANLGVEWLIVTLIPQSEVMKEINANARMIAVLFCSSIVMACTLGIYVYKTIKLSSSFE